MSLPKPIHKVIDVPSHASSPSKSSLRSQRSGVPPRSVLPSPHFDENLELPTRLGPQTTPFTDEQQPDHSIAQQSEELQSPAFQPLFTLLHDSKTSEHHHPTVHYIFADDDTDIITGAALRSLGIEEPLYFDHQPHQSDAEHAVEHEHPPTHLPPSNPTVKEHYILVDLAPNAPAPGNGSLTHHSTTDPITSPRFPYRVASASSFSPSFALLSAEITPAPTFEPPSSAASKRRSGSYIYNSETQHQGQGGHGLAIYTGAAASAIKHAREDAEGPFMLRVSGMSAFDLPDLDDGGGDIDPVRKGKDKDRDSKARKRKSTSGATNQYPPDDEEDGEESLESLALRFEERLSEIRAVLDAAAMLSVDPSQDEGIPPEVNPDTDQALGGEADGQTQVEAHQEQQQQQLLDLDVADENVEQANAKDQDDGEVSEQGDTGV